jgi:hypothetical protein
MKLSRVKGSSNIDRIGYDADANRMTVRFKGGLTYSYADVPPEVHKAFRKAESKGSYFHQHIRGAFEHSKHDEDE